MKRKKIAALFAGLLATALFTSCMGAGEKEESLESSEPVSKMESSLPEEPFEEPSEPEPTEPAGPLNPLTGEGDYPESALGKRPVTVMVNNLNAAIPHRGLSKADILYEVAVEGGITRILAVFANPEDVPYVGPVRSVRHYYTDFAYPYDPIFVHFGGSKPGKAAVADRGLNNVDGLVYGTQVFYKDSWRAQNRGVEHSYFINSEGLLTAANKRGYSLEGEPAPLLAISQEPVAPETKRGGVYVKFSSYTNSQFDYDPETGLYAKSRNGEAHIDADTEETLTFANVLVLVTSITSYDGGDLREVALGSGSGWFFTGGGYEEISWSKGNYQNQFAFTKKDGNPITGNVGPTFVAIIDSSQAPNMSILP